jgi:hypothetical protein
MFRQQLNCVIAAHGPGDYDSKYTQTHCFHDQPIPCLHRTRICLLPSGILWLAPRKRWRQSSMPGQHHPGMSGVIPINAYWLVWRLTKLCITNQFWGKCECLEGCICCSKVPKSSGKWPQLCAHFFFPIELVNCVAAGQRSQGNAHVIWQSNTTQHEM